MSSILSTENLSVEIAGKTICTDLSLNVKQKDCWAILGMNGAGKTTLLHTLAGLRPAKSGSVKIPSGHLHEISRKTVARHIGVLLQDYEDSFPGTVFQTVLTGRHPHMNNWQWETTEDIKIAQDALAFVGLSDFGDRSILNLSGGERRRVAIAALLCQQPQLYLLDEPGNHLDIKHLHTFLDNLVKKIQQQNQASMMIMHDVNLAIRYCNQALLLFDNGDYLQGPCHEVVNRENISRLYNHPMRSVIDSDKEWLIPS